jgi:hypothetical protein
MQAILIEGDRNPRDIYLTRAMYCCYACMGLIVMAIGLNLLQALGLLPGKSLLQG